MVKRQSANDFDDLDDFDDMPSEDTDSFDDVPDYDDIAEQEPPRDIATPAMPEIGARPKTLIEQLEGATDVTDMQAALRMLFPSDLTSQQQVSSLLMVSRIAPEVFLSMIELRSIDEIMMTPPWEKIDVIGTRMKHYGLVSIGLDGRGRIDIAEAIGASREIRREEGMRGLNF